jgi:membrane protein YdbS with pleckstrin-like domain
MVDFDENDTFTVQVLEAMSALIISAFSLVAALAWNEAIKALIAEFLGADDMVGLFVYAIIVTVIAVIMAIFITRSIRKAKASSRAKHKDE